MSVFRIPRTYEEVEDISKYNEIFLFEVLNSYGKWVTLKHRITKYRKSDVERFLKHKKVRYSFLIGI